MAHTRVIDNPGDSASVQRPSPPRTLTFKPKPVTVTKVGLCLDLSGSVSDALDTISGAVRHLVTSLQPAQHARLVVTAFGSDAKVLHPLAPPSTVEPRQLTQGDILGSTNIGAGLSLTGDELLKCDADGPSRSVIILTSDGHNTAHERNPVEVARELESRIPGLTIVTIGVGSASVQELKAIASTPDHYYPASDMERMAKLIADFGRTVSMTTQRAMDPREALKRVD